MYSDRNLVNRRNVKGDVSAAANACRRFFQIEVEARIVAAAMKILCLTKIDEEPPVNKFPVGSDATNGERRNYLNSIASEVVDSFVIDQTRNRNMEDVVKKMQLKEKEIPNVDGRFKCRSQGCLKTFAHPGKLRRDHEATHNPPPEVQDCDSNSVFDEPSTDDSDRDDMFSYQRALLDYGMLILNFWDAISEGDGDRVFRCWKYFLMYLKHQGGSASKYSLEALYLMFQANALLSPQSAHRLLWNRFIKNKPGPGGNIPLDLQLEFYNKTIKEAIKNLGPNASVNSINRICHSLGVTTRLMKTFDTSLSVFKRSGEHVKKSTKGDFEKIVNELVKYKAFHHTPGRRYRYYRRMKSSILSGFDMRKMFTWINEHKKYMILNRRAR